MVEGPREYDGMTWTRHKIGVGIVEEPVAGAFEGRL